MKLSQNSYSKSYLFFCGLLAGAADVVPGISGGTVYFVLGVYKELLEAIATLTPNTLLLLPRLQFRTFCQRVPVGFLAAIFLGVVTSFVTLAHVVVVVLHDPIGRQLLYALFGGLVLGSFIHCVKKVEKFTFLRLLFCVVGAISAFLISGLTTSATLHSDGAYFDAYAFMGGVLAVTAMLLPGISGSYLLAVLGLYAPTLTALLSFLHAIPTGQIHTADIVLLYSLAAGITLGAPIASRAIDWALLHYPSATIAMLSGCMVGSLRAVWPFFKYQFQEVNERMQLVITELTVPTIDLTGAFVIILLLLGIVTVLALERWVRVSK